MNPPPPMPENSGSTTLSANWMAAAASMALPPLRSILAPASAASGCDTATTPPRKPGPGGTASPDASCDAQAGAKLNTVKLSTSNDLRMSGPRSQPAVARIAARAAGIRVRLLDLRQIVVRVLRERVVDRGPGRRELEDPLELRRDAALVVPGHRGVALVFMVAVVVIVLAAAVAITVAIIVVAVAPRSDRPDRQVVEARRVEAEDLALHPRGELGIAIAPAHGLRDPEPPQRLDLPLRRAVPHRVRAEHDAVLAHELQELAKDVGAYRREGDHGRGERRADLGVDVLERRGEQRHLGGPGNVGHALAQHPGVHLVQRIQDPDSRLDARVVEDEVELRPVGRSPGDVDRVAEPRVAAQRVGPQALVDRQVHEPRVLLQDAPVVLARKLVDLRVRGVGDIVIVERPAHHVAVRVEIDLGGGGDVVALPGIGLEPLDLLLDEPQVAYA